jgi:hypothetical protein
MISKLPIYIVNSHDLFYNVLTPSHKLEVNRILKCIIVAVILIGKIDVKHVRQAVLFEARYTILACDCCILSKA